MISAVSLTAEELMEQLQCFLPRRWMCHPTGPGKAVLAVCGAVMFFWWTGFMLEVVEVVFLFIFYHSLFFFHFLLIFPSRTLKTVQLLTGEGLQLWSRKWTTEEQCYQQFGAMVEEKYIVQQEEANQIQTPSLGLGQNSNLWTLHLCLGILFPLLFFFFSEENCQEIFC